MTTGINATLINLLNGSVADATQVMTNFNNLNNGGISNDGGAATTNGAGTVTLPGIVATALLQANVGLTSNLPGATIAGTTAGNATLYQFLLGSVKAAYLSFGGYQNSTATEQKLSLTSAFSTYALWISMACPLTNIYLGG